jgi:hypothetical protein
MTTGEGPGTVTTLDAAVVGKVVEIEPGVVEVAAYRGAAKTQPKARFRVAIVKIEDRLLGAAGLTRVRVGFQADSPGAALSVAMDGCVELARHREADFYVLQKFPVEKKDSGYARELDLLKKTARVIDDPVAALKANALNDRFEAAHIILTRYRTPGSSNAQEPIPELENKLLVALLTELPWVPPGGSPVRADGGLLPHREALW